MLNVFLLFDIVRVGAFAGLLCGCHYFGLVGILVQRLTR